MDEIISDLETAQARLAEVRQSYVGSTGAKQVQTLLRAIELLDRAWSRSWLGYHSRVYTSDLKPRRKGWKWDAFHNPRMNMNDTCGKWDEYTLEEIAREARSLANAPKIRPTKDKAVRVASTFADAKRDTLAILNALVHSNRDSTVRKTITTIEGISPKVPAEMWLSEQRPRPFPSSDYLAATEGITTPLHLHIKALLREDETTVASATRLIGEIDFIVRYLKTRRELRTDRTHTGSKIFIGHGRADTWLKLRIFLTEKLDLEVIEFNMQSSAGKPFVQRLEEMLNESAFAFIVMTAEDEQVDGNFRARENVIHEAGLFQGRLGFQKAIILKEDNCQEFSNIHGLTQIHFPNGEIMAKSEEIRDVLIREGVLP